MQAIGPLGIGRRSIHLDRARLTPSSESIESSASFPQSGQDYGPTCKLFVTLTTTKECIAMYIGLGLDEASSLPRCNVAACPLTKTVVNYNPRATNFSTWELMAAIRRRDDFPQSLELDG